LIGVRHLIGVRRLSGVCPAFVRCLSGVCPVFVRCLFGVWCSRSSAGQGVRWWFDNCAVTFLFGVLSWGLERGRVRICGAWCGQSRTTSDSVGQRRTVSDNVAVSGSAVCVVPRGTHGVCMRVHAAVIALIRGLWWRGLCGLCGLRTTSLGQRHILRDIMFLIRCCLLSVLVSRILCYLLS
jgi:hypothetical protein